MARKRRRGRRGLIPKTAGGAVSLTFKVIGGVVALSPFIGVVQKELKDGAWASLGKDTLFAYTGYSMDGGNLNSGQTGVGVASIVGGVLLAKAGSVLGRMIH